LAPVIARRLQLCFSKFWSPDNTSAAITPIFAAVANFFWNSFDHQQRNLSFATANKDAQV
jgi:hypothetical protein